MTEFKISLDDTELADYMDRKGIAISDNAIKDILEDYFAYVEVEEL